MIGRCAGVLIPLFSVRSVHDFGRGEFGGLIPMADMALAMGHRLLQLLPIDEVAPGETSPYSALSVFALDPIYLSLRLLPASTHATVTRFVRQSVVRTDRLTQHGCGGSRIGCSRRLTDISSRAPTAS